MDTQTLVIVEICAWAVLLLVFCVKPRVGRPRGDESSRSSSFLSCDDETERQESDPSSHPSYAPTARKKGEVDSFGPLPPSDDIE